MTGAGAGARRAGIMGQQLRVRVKRKARDRREKRLKARKAAAKAAV